MEQTIPKFGLVPFEQVCKALGASKSKANRLIAEGKFPVPLRIGVKPFFLESQIREFLAAEAMRAAECEQARRQRRKQQAEASVPA